MPLPLSMSAQSFNRYYRKKCESHAVCFYLGSSTVNYKMMIMMMMMMINCFFVLLFYLTDQQIAKALSLISSQDRCHRFSPTCREQEWACAEPEFRLFLVKLCSSGDQLDNYMDNRYRSMYTAQKMKFSMKDLFSKCNQ